ncbi:hypothetical protein BKI52_44100 [marine bacterium AO1-C]|nr:hypothetical protein BKI52_44100 [marine bacterium AO1-C]
MEYFNLLIEVSNASVLLFAGLYYLTSKKNKNIGLNLLGVFLFMLGLHYALLIMTKLLYNWLTRLLEDIKVFTFLLHAYIPLLYLITYHYRFNRDKIDRNKLWLFLILLLPTSRLVLEHLFVIDLKLASDATSFGGCFLMTIYNLVELRKARLPKFDQKLIVHINLSFLLMILVWVLVILNRLLINQGENYVIMIFLFAQLYLVYGLVYHNLHNPSAVFKKQYLSEKGLVALQEITEESQETPLAEQPKEVTQDFNTNQEQDEDIHKIVVPSQTQKDWIKLDLQHLLFLKSSDNYVAVHYLDSANVIKKKLIRNTLKNLEQQALHPALVRCHQSYIINLEQVTEVVKKKGATFFLIHSVEDLIPIAKTRQKEVLSKMETLLS